MTTPREDACARCGEARDRGVHDTAETCEEVRGPCLDPASHHPFVPPTTPREDAIAAVRSNWPDDYTAAEAKAWIAACDRIEFALGAEAETLRPGITTMGEQRAFEAGYAAGRADATAPAMELTAEAETPPGPINDHERDCPDCRRVIAEERASWVDLASPETAEALAQTLADMDIWNEVHKHEDTNTLAAAILAAMRETGR